MKILLIGATGGTGREILPRLLAAGHSVTALVRRPEAVTTTHEHLVGAMTKHGVKRLVNLSAWGAQDTQKPIGLMQVMLQGVLLRNIFADKKRGEKLLFASDLEYVNVCPGRLLNKPARGGVKASAEGTGIQHSMTRADLAQWMVDQLTSDTWVRTSPIIG